MVDATAFDFDDGINVKVLLMLIVFICTEERGFFVNQESANVQQCKIPVGSYELCSSPRYQNTKQTTDLLV